MNRPGWVLILKKNNLSCLGEKKLKVIFSFSRSSINVLPWFILMNWILFFSLLSIHNLLLMSLSLLGKKSYTGINPFIASILIVFAEIITFNVLIFQNILIDYSFLFFLNYILIFIIPPHFLHIINYFLGDNGKPFSIKKLVHFIPLAISMVLLLWLCLQPAGFRHNFFAQINKGDRPLLSTILGIVFFLQFTIYVLIAYRKVFLYRKNNPETEVVKWLWIFINAVLFIIVFTYFFIFVFLFSISVILICCSASTIVLYDLFSFKSLKN